MTTVYVRNTEFPDETRNFPKGSSISSRWAA
jgi:hypothetical protein